MRLAGETALVTGATSGIGRAVAMRFAAEGAYVVVSGRSAERGAAVVASIQASGGSAVFVPADLAEPGAPAALVDVAADRLGGLSVLVNNHVSRHGDGSLLTISAPEFEARLRVDLLAVTELCRAALPHLVASRGSILNISSRVATRAVPGLAAYSAAKGALEALTRSIAVDHGRDGVRCNTIAPGYVVRGDETDDELARRQAMQLTRLTTADDVAYAAVYLASRESEAVTGSLLYVDGGGHAARAAVVG
jgi:NAD(P)-dependent dehydrogenase (short-subunit alcohol dehydrogenase family)